MKDCAVEAIFPRIGRTMVLLGRDLGSIPGALASHRPPLSFASVRPKRPHTRYKEPHDP